MFTSRVILSRIAGLFGVVSCLVFRAGAGSLPNLADAQSIGERLVRQLPEARRQGINLPLPQLSNDTLPRLSVIHSPSPHIEISQSGLDFIIAFSRAKAFDTVQKHYLRDYLVLVATAPATHPIPALPGETNAAFSTLGVENEFLTNFNQILGGLLAIQTALLNKQTGSTSIREEWAHGFDAGIRLAVSCAYGVEGLGSFWESLENMPNRPSWATALLPPDGRGRKAGSDAARIQKKMLR